MINIDRAMRSNRIMKSTGSLLTLLDTPIMNTDGELNNEIIEVVKSSKDFLTEIGKINFKDFKKSWFKKIFGL